MCAISSRQTPSEGHSRTVVTGVGTVFKLLAGVIAFLLSPIGLVIAAVAAMGAYLVYATGAGGKALTWLGEKFGVIKDDALTAYQGIADALAAGDISLAVKVLWLTLKMEWTRGINFLEKAWLNPSPAPATAAAWRPAGQ